MNATRITMVLLLTAAIALAFAASAETVTVRPKATDEALINPDMGWVFYKYSNRLWAYGINTPDSDTLDWFPGCSTVYMRVLWNDIEPEVGEEGQSLFSVIESLDAADGKLYHMR